MTQLTRPQFNLDEPFIALKEIKSNGMVFTPGEMFPWVELGLTRRRVGQMWDIRLISNSSPEIVALIQQVHGCCFDISPDSREADNPANSEFLDAAIHIDTVEKGESENAASQ